LVEKVGCQNSGDLSVEEYSDLSVEELVDQPVEESADTSGPIEEQVSLLVSLLVVLSD